MCVTTTFDVADSNLISNHGVLLCFLDILNLWQLIYRFVVSSWRISLKSMLILPHGWNFQMCYRWGSVLHYSIILWLRRPIDRGIGIDLDLGAHCWFDYRMLLRRVAWLLETFCISRYLELFFDWENTFLATVFLNLILCFGLSEGEIFLRFFLGNIIFTKWKMMLIFLLFLDARVVLSAESE